jgi:hypothetical protein
VEQQMGDLTKKQFPKKIGGTNTTRIPLPLTAIIAGLLFSIMSLLTGCGSGGEAGGDPSITVTPGSGSVGATASLAWNPVSDPSVTAYFVHYGQQSPNQSGSCVYESSISVDSPSATITNLDPNTLYYFTVSAYNGLESACSNEVSTVTPPASA